MHAETGELKTKKVREVAAKEFLYSHVKNDKSRCFKVEKQLAEMETMVARMYPRIADGFPDLVAAGGIKKMLALFIVSLILRHPDSELATQATHRGLLELFEQAPKDSKGRPLISHFIQDGMKHAFDATEYEDYKTADENMIKQIFSEQIRPLAASLAEKLFTKRWVFFVCEQPVFFTSDKPVIQQHTEVRKYGLGTPGVHLWFPVTPYRMLWMCDRENVQSDGFYPLPEHEAAALNAFTMANATQFLLSHESPDARMQDVGRLAAEVRIRHLSR